MKKNIKQDLSWFNRLHAIHKLLISAVLAVSIYLIFPEKHLNSVAHLMVGWDIFCISNITLSFITFFTLNSDQVCDQCSKQDESRVIIFFVVLVATMASLLAVILLITSKSEDSTAKAWQLPIAIIGMMSSWILVHTTFAFRYAHIFYGSEEKGTGKTGTGLDFPGEKDPDYLDFAYFSFVLGMTFQVSDISITSKRLRKIALLHSLVSFGFNTVVVALTINVVAGLGS
ncbi:MAG: DUF1345 domain-containing protein [Ferruginibacter sp.]